MKALAIYIALILYLILAVPVYLAYNVLILLKLIHPKADTTFAAKRFFLTKDEVCNSCSGNFHKQFDSEKKFIDFETKLRESFSIYAIVPHETSEPNLKFLGYSFGGHSYKGGVLYLCKNCKQIWELSEPDYAWRGYFKPIDWLSGEPKEILETIEKNYDW